MAPRAQVIEVWSRVRGNDGAGQGLLLGLVKVPLSELCSVYVCAVKEQAKWRCLTVRCGVRCLWRQV